MLRERLKAAEDGDVSAVREAAQKDADRLSQLPFGAPMLHLIGCAMELPPGGRARVRRRALPPGGGPCMQCMCKTHIHAIGMSLMDGVLSQRLRHPCGQ